MNPIRPASDAPVALKMSAFHLWSDLPYEMRHEVVNQMGPFEYLLLSLTSTTRGDTTGIPATASHPTPSSPSSSSSSLFSITLKHPPLSASIRPELVFHAASLGSTSLFMWLHTHHYPITPQDLTKAASSGHLQLLNWASQQASLGPHPMALLAQAAAQSGQWEVVRFLERLGFAGYQLLLQPALRDKEEEFISHALSLWDLSSRLPATVELVAKFGRKDLLEKLFTLSRRKGELNALALLGPRGH